MSDDPFDPNTWDWDSPVEIFLTKGKVCLVSQEDASLATSRLWFATRDGYGKSYAARSIHVDGKHKLVWLHKEILKRMYDPPTEAHFIGDHMDGNSLNNQRSNLRWATLDENNRNKYGFYMKQMRLAI